MLLQVFSQGGMKVLAAEGEKHHVAALGEDGLSMVELLETFSVEYIPLTRLKGDCYVYFCTRREFARMRRAGELPRGKACYYARDLFDPSERQIMGLRQVPDLTVQKVSGG